VFTNTSTFVNKWGSSGSADGQFDHPVGIAVDGGGNVFVADNGNLRVQIYTDSGTFLAEWGSAGPETGSSWLSRTLRLTRVETISSATNSLVSHFSLVTKVYFPREILPLTYVIAALVDFLVASFLLGALMVWYDMSLSRWALLAIPTVGVLALFAIAVSLLLCAIQVRYRDIGMALPLLLQVWMFATPVVYPLTLVPQRWQALYSLNPMVGIVESFRRVILQGAPPDYHSLEISALITAVLLPVAFIYFKHVEATVADII